MSKSNTTRTILLWTAVARVATGIAAIPLAPLLYKDNFLWLVFLRPTKEIFLAGGFLARRGELNLLLLIAAAIPLSILGVWLFFFLGRAYKKEIHNDELPGIAGRVINPDRVKKFEKALDKRGLKLIFLGRMAVMSSAAVAAAAGAAGMEPRRFIPIDLLGGLVSIAYTVGAGYALGEAYERAGPWLTAVGVVAMAAFAYILGRSLKSD
jgi:membrane protein DedA with SNARE-associated domain